MIHQDKGDLSQAEVNFIQLYFSNDTLFNPNPEPEPSAGSGGLFTMEKP